MTTSNAITTQVTLGDYMRGWAEYYDRQGLIVAPAAGKIPVELWKQIRANDRSLFSQPNWFGPTSVNNIVILTGRISRIFVLDVDVSGGKSGALSLQSLEAKHGALPTTLSATTGTGGRHFYFKAPALDPDEKIASMVNAFKDEGLPDIDIRGDGGVIVAPPSVHPVTFRHYTWDTDLRAGPLFSLIADAPQWLLDKAVRKKHKSTDVSIGAYKHLLGAPVIAKLLSKACSRIEQAANGEQERTLFAMSKDMGKLVGAGALDYDQAREALVAAGKLMRNFNPARPWTVEDVREKVELSMMKGMPEPKDLSWVNNSNGKRSGYLSDRNPTAELLGDISDEIITDLFTWRQGLTEDATAHDIEHYISHELSRIKLLPKDWQEEVYDQIAEFFPAHVELVEKIKAMNIPAISTMGSEEIRPQVSDISTSSEHLNAALKPQSELDIPQRNGFDLVNAWDVSMPRMEFVAAVQGLQEKIHGLSLREIQAVFGQLKLAFASYSKEVESGLCDAVITSIAAGGPGAPSPGKAADVLGKSVETVKRLVKERRAELMRQEITVSTQASEALVGYDMSPYFLNEEGVGKWTGESAERISSQRIWVASICRNMATDGVNQVQIGLEEDTGGIAMHYLPYAAINDKHILKTMPGIRASNGDALCRYIDEMTTRVKNLGRTVYTADRYCWVDDQFIYQDAKIHGFPIEYTGTLKPISGDTELWKEAYSRLVQLPVEENYTAIAAIALCAASILVARYGRRNPVLVLSSKTSSGKGSSVELGTSIWYSPDDNFVSAQSTIPGFEDRGRELAHLPLVADDVHLIKPKPGGITPQLLLYGMGDNAFRTTSHKTQQARGGGKRIGPGIIVSESTVVEGEHQGALNRAIELRQSPLPPGNKALSDFMKRAAKANAGAMGALIVSCINEKIAEFDEFFPKCVDDIQARGVTEATMADTLAFVIAGVNILQRITSVGVDVEKLTECLLAATKDYVSTTQPAIEAFYQDVLNLIATSTPSSYPTTTTGQNYTRYYAMGQLIAMEWPGKDYYEVVGGAEAIERLAEKHKFASERATRRLLADHGWLIRPNTSKGLATRRKMPDGVGVQVIYYAKPSES